MINQHILADKHLIIVQLRGPVSFDQVVAQIHGMTQDPLYDPSMDGVLDLRKAEPQVSPEQAEELGSLAVQKGVARGRWAYVADSPLTTALAMLYRERTSMAHDSEIFSTIEAAARYIGQDISKYLHD